MNKEQLHDRWNSERITYDTRLDTTKSSSTSWSLSLSLSLSPLPSYPSLRPESQKILLCGAESMLFCQNQSGILSQLISRMRGCVCLLHVFVWMEKGGLIKDEFKHGCQTLYKSLS